MQNITVRVVGLSISDLSKVCVRLNFEAKTLLESSLIMGSVLVGSAVGGAVGSGMATILNGVPEIGLVCGGFSGGYIGFVWSETSKAMSDEMRTNATYRLHTEE